MRRETEAKGSEEGHADDKEEELEEEEAMDRTTQC